MTPLRPTGDSRIREPLLLSRRFSRLFVIVFLLLAIGAAGLAVRSALRLHSDPELKNQLEDVHEQAPWKGLRG